MDSTLRRTWAEIDMDALAHNYETLRIGENVKFLGVVKADAYGHGSVQVSRLLQESGADYLAVSSIDEAVELRHNGITMPVLILGHTPKEEVSELIKNNITQAVTCRAKALEYSEEAVKCGGTLKIHIKVDTGMSRLGFPVAKESVEEECQDLDICVTEIILKVVLKEYVKAVLFQVLMLREYSHILQYLMNLEKNMKAILSISLNCLPV